MEDVTVDIGRPLNARNLKSMGMIDQVRAKPTLNTSWETLKHQRKIPNALYLFSKTDPSQVVAYYLQDLANQGVDISEFSVDWLPEHPPHFMKRTREPSKKSKKAKKAKLGESSGSRPLVPLVDSPSKSIPLSRSVKLKPIASSLPQTTPIYTSSETPPSTTRASNPPFLKFNLATTTLPVSEAEMLNETTPPSSSSSPQSPSYYVLSSDNEPYDPQPPTLAQLHTRALASQQPSQTEPEPEVTSPPPEQQYPPTYEPQTPPSEPQPNPPPEQPIHSPSEPQLNPQPKQTTPSPSAIPTPPTSVATITPILNLDNTNPPSPSSPTFASEPESAFPTLEEAINVFAESSVEKIKSLTINSAINDDPSAVRIHWNRVISWMTSEAFKLKGLSKQVRNDFIRDAGFRLQALLDIEVEEQAKKEVEEKARLEEEKRIREAEEKAAAAEAEAKAKTDAKEATRIAAEEAAKARADALTQGEQSNSGFAPLVLKTLGELQKEQQVVRAKLDHQDSVNTNIQNMLPQLLQRMPPPRNP
ncbi:uncharacterized protein LOC127136515 [Lathyrus oleraceus]|uniref:uncharacterized protein LOC127136515 n=1 Tax=Pisum sativum TaxID=3888 RepID=UPI0021D22134|nr:uncharacterized protein LOC127136515 [Pisum sativum]